MGIIRRLPAALLLSLFALRNTLASACSPGQYKSTANNAKQCLVCPPGSVTNTLNASNGTTCTPCAPGLYSNDSTVPCASCAPGKYSSLSAERHYGSGLVARYTVPARPRIVDGNARGLVGTPGPALVAFKGMNDAKRWTTARIKGQEVNVLRFAGDGYLKGAGQTLPSGKAARTSACFIDLHRPKLTVTCRKHMMPVRCIVGESTRINPRRASRSMLPITTNRALARIGTGFCGVRMAEFLSR